ncbi:MAG TPA: hypothetical protein VFS07_04435, partial [Gemmatimonadales bacterium]|nr:hypothetical protein [Gemmatimonadales bacterium]
MRPSHPALLAAHNTLADRREAIVAEWRSRLGERAAASETVPAELLTRMMSLLVELLAESAGPLRREVREIWARASEHYGRAAAARGLAAGEVVDEFATLRDALTRDL